MSEIITIKDYKLACEANIVSCLWKQPELFITYDSLQLKDFTHNEWKVYWTIGNEIVIKENKPILDDITVGLYLEKHPKLRTKYEEYGGYTIIENATEYVNVENVDGYIKELQKWNVVLQLAKNKFPVKDRLKEFADMSTQEIYEEYEAMINHLFINVDNEVKSYNLCEGLHELIEECNSGTDVGFPIDSEILNAEIGGNMLGNITLMGALSGTGKTTTTIELILPNMIKLNEKVVMVINEQDEKKLRKEMITWVANNIYKGEFNKKRLREGKFSQDELDLLKKSADWLEEKKINKNITIIPLQTYTADRIIKIMSKYSAMGVKYFILDTFKESDDSREESWKSMMKDMRRIYDAVKPASKNLHIWVTLQLKKTQSTARYLTVDSIGMSKNVVDVASTVLLMRGVFDDEKEGGKNQLNVYRLEGKNKRTKIPVKLHPDKKYAIIFIDKNREGESQTYQLVVENDLGKNMYKEVGITIVPEDW